MTITDIATPQGDRLRDRISSLLDLTYLAEGELHLAVYRAHLAGMPHDDLIHIAGLSVESLHAVIASFRTMTGAERRQLLNAPEMRWRNANGCGTYG